jgi:DNA-binding NarL/FixJ family response regulator
VIRVLVVDDHVFVRTALVMLLSADEGIAVVGECADGTEVLEAVAETHPDVVLMDIEMPVLSGLDATRQLVDARSPARVLIQTGSSARVSAREAEAAGAAGYLPKGSSPDLLVDAIRAVALGQTCWPVGYAPRDATA